MSSHLTIDVDWERLDAGTPEERACFGALGIRHDNIWLSSAEDTFIRRIRERALLSGYRLAEWLAWNWWRIRWEPRKNTLDWAMSHRMTTIGGGYVWPNITIMSDGERLVLLAKPTAANANESLRYVTDFAAGVEAGTFEAAVDTFISQMRGQLREEGVGTTNLDRIWDEVLAERSDPQLQMRRRFEALLGADPDEGNSAQIEQLVQDAILFGERAMNEVAADRQPLTAAQMQAIAEENGYSASPADAVKLINGAAGLPAMGKAPAWLRGAVAARELREQEKLGTDAVSNDLLAEMGGVSKISLEERDVGRAISFSLDENSAKGHIVFRSKWETGRRFELARLIGDRLASGAAGKLRPATRAHTYRQQMQRSFAAELLCPFVALDEILAGDYSDEAQVDAAYHFDVSEMTVQTILINHKRIPRDELDLSYYDQGFEQFGINA